MYVRMFIRTCVCTCVRRGFLFLKVRKEISVIGEVRIAR